MPGNFQPSFIRAATTAFANQGAVKEQEGNCLDREDKINYRFPLV